MPNLLALPTKRPGAWDLRDAFKEHIRLHHPDTHPDAFKHDLSRWEQLRDGALKSPEAALQYHAHLAFALTKLPSDIGLEVSYRPAFTNGSPTTHRSLDYERRAVLWNAAAQYAQLGGAADRSTADGIRRAASGFSNAAGVLDYLLDLKDDDGLRDPDLEDDIVRSVRAVMLAQAQECAWQLAVLNHTSNGTVAKISQEVSALYASATSPPPAWSSHVQTKAAHFGAAAQYRASMDDLDKRRYGEEIARLTRAKADAQAGVLGARRVAAAVLDDIKTLLGILDTALTRAERDNDLIYHATVPSFASLPLIKGARLAQPAPMRDPASLVGGDEGLLAGLVPWGARVALDVFRERNEAAVREVESAVADADAEVASALRGMGLPAALEALERPAGLPPSLLGKAQQVRLEDGPARIRRKQEALDAVRKADAATLDEAFDMLDAEDDPPPELVQRAQVYLGHLDTAGNSDALVRAKWEEVETMVEVLAWEESDLERAVPSSTGPSASSTSESRALRAALDDLEDARVRVRFIASTARSTAEADDISARVERQVRGMERWSRVTPALFGDIIDEAVGRYEEMLTAVEEGREGLKDLLQRIEDADEQFKNARKGSNAVRTREQKLRELEHAHAQYVEINSNLDEGLKFYNDLAERLARLKTECSTWLYERRTQGKNPPPPAPAEPPKKAKAPAFGLPPPDSDEWVDFAQLKLGKAKTKAKR
ncbi:BRO1-domain-containing protein [Exidia glandulosa HHB12029]|uniref:BRO1-domain-containing protein n=1 Tax=Exidia glandulosa HHB12029 TaxID=1314781 RepID=A0A165QHU3_EXIGL|nr:BRO1-domain-containing protein [Exidia glandulosa HHB12029]